MQIRTINLRQISLVMVWTEVRTKHDTKYWTETKASLLSTFKNHLNTCRFPAQPIYI